MTVTPPGSTIGIIGSGQLGRMLGMAAAELGYRVHIYAPESGPANDVASAFTRGAYDDIAALSAFGAAVDLVTYEFENIAVPPLRPLADQVTVRPSLRALEVAQERTAEKSFIDDLGGRTAPWRAVETREELGAALAAIGVPAILKTTRFGYDGKGQARILAPEDADAAWQAIGSGPAILEGLVDFACEFSILLARGPDGITASYAPPRNAHRDGILHRSTLPAPNLVAAQAPEATALAERAAESLGYVGLIALEFFATADGPVFNEMAPRVHNSGHWTTEGAETSQFENHIRAICGLPLGSTALTGTRVEMENLIGEEAERWPELMAEPGAHLHLYGKREIRPGRKMGHVTRVWRHPED